LDIGGEYITDHLIELLKESKDNPNLRNMSYDKNIFNQIKENHCQVAYDFDSSLKEF
jgi:actin-related protein